MIRSFFRYPTTIGLIWFCSALFVVTLPWRGLPYGTQNDGLRFWGASVGLASVQEPALHGLFDVWNGEWWRILVSGLHHGSLLHLFFNMTSLWELGRVLESRWGSFRWLAFLLVGIAVSMPGEFLLGHGAIGISGSLCAAIGAIFVLARHDPELAKRWPPDRIGMVIGILLVMAALTHLGVLQIANLAHFTGLLWGMLVAEMGWAWNRTRSITGPVFIGAHLVLIPLFWTATHPGWIAEYHWWNAEQATDPVVKNQFYQQAVACNSRIPAVWDRWVTTLISERDYARAWGTTLRGLKANPADPKLTKLAQQQWFNFAGTAEHDAALDVLRTVFGKEAPKWEQFFRRDPFQPLPDDLSKLRHLPQVDGNRFRLDQQVDLRLPVDTDDQQPAKIKLPDPDRVDSAVEGRTL